VTGENVKGWEQTPARLLEISLAYIYLSIPTRSLW